MFWGFLFSGNYNCGCVVATSFIFSQTSGSSFDVNINRLLGTCMGLAVGNFPVLLSLDFDEHLLRMCFFPKKVAVDVKNTFLKQDSSIDFWEM